MNYTFLFTSSVTLDHFCIFHVLFYLQFSTYFCPSMSQQLNNNIYGYNVLAKRTMSCLPSQLS